MNDNVISVKRWPKCNHRRFILDESLSKIECSDCGEMLNPIWVINELSCHERRLKNRVEILNKEAEKAKKKNRCKCEHCGKMTRIQK